MLIQIDPTSIEFDLRNILFDPTDGLGEGFAKVISESVNNVIINADRLIKEMVDGLIQVLKSPISIDYGRIITQRSQFSLSSGLRKESSNVLMASLLLLVGVSTLNPVVVFAGFGIFSIIAADYYLD